MKFYTSCFLLIVFLFAGCNSNPANSVQQSGSATEAVEGVAASNPADVVSLYLKLKNTLAADDTKGAATAGGQMLAALKDLSTAEMTAQQKSAFAEIAPDAEENTDHISRNAGNIKHQREHFASLSDDMYSFVKAFGSPVTLYRDYCPMKDAYWLSEVKEIRNPYYGSEMATCGEIKETLNP